jgi:hypothetical protein
LKLQILDILGILIRPFTLETAKCLEHVIHRLDVLPGQARLLHEVAKRLGVVGKFPRLVAHVSHVLRIETTAGITERAVAPGGASIRLPALALAWIAESLLALIGTPTAATASLTLLALLALPSTLTLLALASTLALLALASTLTLLALASTLTLLALPSALTLLALASALTLLALASTLALLALLTLALLTLALLAHLPVGLLRQRLHRPQEVPSLLESLAAGLARLVALLIPLHRVSRLANALLQRLQVVRDFVLDGPRLQ